MNAPGVKRHATVVDVDDPKQLGRIKVELGGFGEHSGDARHRITPWCWPCTPFAGPGYGFFCLPQIGDEVWVEQAAGGEWVYTGFYWTGRNQKPADGQEPDVRVFRTPVGHQLKLDENGDVEIVHANGNVIAMRHNGDIEILSTKDLNVEVAGEANITCGGKAMVTASMIELNGASGKVVTTSHICAYTGSPHVLGSATVKAGG